MGFDKQENITKNENVLAGIVGAFLFSLGGGVVWFLLHLTGVFASISGFVGVFLAILGYKLFAKKESIKGIIIASVIAFAVLVLAWYLCVGKDIYDAYQYYYNSGEIDYTLSYADSLRSVPSFLSDPEIGPSCYRDLIIGLVFALIGSVGTITPRQLLRRLLTRRKTFLRRRPKIRSRSVPRKRTRRFANT